MRKTVLKLIKNILFQIKKFEIEYVNKYNYKFFIKNI